MVLQTGKCGCFVLINKWCSWVESALHTILLYMQSVSNGKWQPFYALKKMLILLVDPVHTIWLVVRCWHSCSSPVISNVFKWRGIVLGSTVFISTKMQWKLGSGCGSVGWAVASNSKGPQFESSHLQTFILNIYCQLCEKTKIKKRGREWPTFIKKSTQNDKIRVNNKNMHNIYDNEKRSTRAQRR